MAKLKKYNLSGQEIGAVEVDDRLAKAEANSQSIKDYIVAIRANARQWSANTKNRSEVKHTTKKPRPQKGTGRARQGSLVTPQYRGGGIVFGPKPKFDQHIRINKKEKRAAIRFLIGEKIRQQRLFVIDALNMEQPKTKAVVKFMSALGKKERALFLGEANEQEVEVEDKKSKVSIHSAGHRNFAKSIRNLPKTEFKLAKNISGYDLMLAGDLFITEAALQQVAEWLL